MVPKQHEPTGEAQAQNSIIQVENHFQEKKKMYLKDKFKHRVNECVSFNIKAFDLESIFEYHSAALASSSLSSILWYL